jgi:flagellar biosynthetic protein FliR
VELTLYGVNIWGAALVFARVGAIISLLPGFGEPAVPQRFRLALALLVVVTLVPSIAPNVPPPPQETWQAAAMITNEVAVGLFIGSIARMMFAALATAGQVVGNEIGLAFAQVADPTMSQAGQIFSVYLSILGVAMVFATDLHHVFLTGIVRSYATFQAGILPNLGDAAEMAVTVTGQSFAIGVQIAAPLILAGLIFRLGLGVLSRLIPNIQVFFVTMPLSLLGGFVIFAMGLSGGMIVWLDRLQQQAVSFP